MEALMRTRRLVISLLACTAFAVPVVAAPVQATHHETRTYVLPGENVYPEGIAVFGSQSTSPATLAARCSGVSFARPNGGLRPER